MKRDAAGTKRVAPCEDDSAAALGPLQQDLKLLWRSLHARPNLPCKRIQFHQMAHFFFFLLTSKQFSETKMLVLLPNLSIRKTDVQVFV